MKLSDYGITAEAAGLPFLRVTSKPQEIRIVENLPVPPQKPDSRIKTLARFRVETTNPLGYYLWDVSSKRALAQLAQLDDVAWPFLVSRTGKGHATLYDIAPKPLPTYTPEEAAHDALEEQRP